MREVLGSVIGLAPAFVALALVSALVVRGMIWLAIMDVPAGRKAHARPTPKAGGVGVIVACLAVVPVFWPVSGGPWLAGLLAAGGLGLVGLADDVRDRGVAVKLVAQLLAAGLAVAMGPFDWGWMGLGLAALWLIFMTNMFNFMDGLDGLASGTGLVAAVFVALVAPQGGAVQIGAMALAAGLAGFLPFNLAPARIFLGDVGSQFSGFFLGFLGLCLAGAPAGMPDRAGGIWLVPMLLGGMLFDVVLTLVRRVRARARLTEAHREHLYQRAPLPAAWVAGAHWGFALCGGVAWLVGGGWAWALLIVPQLAWLRVQRGANP